MQAFFNSTYLVRGIHATAAGIVQIAASSLLVGDMQTQEKMMSWIKTAVSVACDRAYYCKVVFPGLAPINPPYPSGCCFYESCRWEIIVFQYPHTLALHLSSTCPKALSLSTRVDMVCPFACSLTTPSTKSSNFLPGSRAAGDDESSVEAIAIVCTSPSWSTREEDTRAQTAWVPRSNAWTDR